ncbi:sqh [Bugula neritina]|uniref:Sqh n=1 Tax=Bugula neritina TaxID=10212 RepID=A0A7J7JL27_BUGNE|nr:sqh [Bugula neritina]
MSSRKVGAGKPRRAQRATSNVFAMFDQAQIQEFKEAFNMIDQNRDGFIDKEDLGDMLASLEMSYYDMYASGKNVTDQYLEGMINEALVLSTLPCFSQCSARSLLELTLKMLSRMHSAVSTRKAQLLLLHTGCLSQLQPVVMQYEYMCRLIACLSFPNQLYANHKSGI